MSLKKKFDVRTQYEFNILRCKGAIQSEQSVDVKLFFKST